MPKTRAPITTLSGDSADLSAAEARLDQLRRSEGFHDPASDEAREFSRLSVWAATMRAQVRASCGGRRGPAALLQPARRY